MVTVRHTPCFPPTRAPPVAHIDTLSNQERTVLVVRAGIASKEFVSAPADAIIPQEDIVKRRAKRIFARITRRTWVSAVTVQGAELVVGTRFMGTATGIRIGTTRVIVGNTHFVAAASVAVAWILAFDVIILDFPSAEPSRTAFNVAAP